MEKPKKKVVVKKKETKRDLTITKECDYCGVSYHPKKNGYEMISRFCTIECTRNGKSKNQSW